MARGSECGHGNRESGCVNMARGEWVYRYGKGEWVWAWQAGARVCRHGNGE